MGFCKEYNAATQDKEGTVIPVEITVYDVRCFHNCQAVENASSTVGLQEQIHARLCSKLKYTFLFSLCSLIASLAFSKKAGTKLQWNAKSFACSFSIGLVLQDRSFTFILKTPPASVLLKKAANIPSGSGEPNSKNVGSVTRQQLKVLFCR